MTRVVQDVKLKSGQFRVDIENKKILFHADSEGESVTVKYTVPLDPTVTYPKINPTTNAADGTLGISVSEAQGDHTVLVWALSYFTFDTLEHFLETLACRTDD